MNRKERTLFVTVVVSALLVLFKFWLATVSGSLSLRASAAHSIADAAVSIFVLLGLVMVRTSFVRKRLGASLSRLENVLALGVAAAIFYAGFDIVKDVLASEPPELENLFFVAIASLMTIPVAFFIARYLQYVGKQTDSPALTASGYHAQLDIYASIVVVAGLAGAALGIPNLDRAAAAVVVVFVLFAGYEIVTTAWQGLKKPTQVNDAATTGEAWTNSHLHPHSSASLLRLFLPVAGIALIAFYLLSGVYTVQPGEAAVVRRFGRVVPSAFGPGLHYRLPWPVERVDIVQLEMLRRIETANSLMLTGDENLIAIRLSLHYTVKDAASFLLNVTAPDTLVKQAADAAMRQVVSQERVDALITTYKNDIQQRAAQLAQQMLDLYNVGITVNNVQLLQSDPPVEVGDAFRDVASAREDRNTFINEALAYHYETLALARADSATGVQVAAAYRAQKLATARSEAYQFSTRLGAYAAAPQVTRTRLYLESVERVLPGMRKYIVSEAIKLQTTDLSITDSPNPQTFPPQP